MRPQMHALFDRLRWAEPQQFVLVAKHETVPHVDESIQEPLKKCSRGARDQRVVQELEGRVLDEFGRRHPDARDDAFGVSPRPDRHRHARLRAHGGVHRPH